ncbi:hypothetical protein EDB84DRAFT_1566048 [Lactarius hengduanensis]|nr:hypothetical protein EDB84DRAFT_1566048 [Lactarius hengduanensis]
MPNPQEQSSLHDIINHMSFTHGILPGYIPVSVQDIPPDFRHLSPVVSQANLSHCGRRANLTGRSSQPRRVTSSPAPSTNSSLAQQECEFQKAVEPGTPIAPGCARGTDTPLPAPE